MLVYLKKDDKSYLVQSIEMQVFKNQTLLTQKSDFPFLLHD